MRPECDPLIGIGCREPEPHTRLATLQRRLRDALYHRDQTQHQLTAWRQVVTDLQAQIVEAERQPVGALRDQ